MSEHVIVQPFASFPLETHNFSGDHNDYLCRTCHHPRAMHYRYPFSPRPDLLDTGEFKVRYEGHHPHFRVLHSKKYFEEISISKYQREYAKRFRENESLALKNILSAVTANEISSGLQEAQTGNLPSHLGRHRERSVVTPDPTSDLRLEDNPMNTPTFQGQLSDT